MAFSVIVVSVQAVLAMYVLFQEGVSLYPLIVSVSVTGGALLAYHHLCVSAQACSSASSGLVDLSRIKALEDELNRDSLTGILNRRAIVHRASEMQKAWSGGEVRWFVAVADLDFFKLINDKHGHRVGDAVLQCVAAFFRARMRCGEYVARYGGEEFCFIIGGDCMLTVMGRLEDLRRGVESHICGMVTELNSPVTVSIGISEWRIDYCDFDEAVDGADLALYSAKASGRNCVRRYAVDNGSTHDHKTSGGGFLAFASTAGFM